MFCKNCGSEIKEGKFCVNCGSKVDEELKVEFERIWEEYGDFYRCLNEVTKAVVEDVGFSSMRG